MLVVDIILIATFTGFFLVAIRRPANELDELDKKEHKLYFLYPMAKLMLTVLGVDKHFQSKAEISDSIRALNITSKPENLHRVYLYQKMSYVIVVIVLFSILSLLGELSSEPRLLRDGRCISRPEHGEGKKEVALDVTLQDSEGSAEDNGPPISRRITLEVKERSYSKEEIALLFEQGKEYLSEYVLGGNKNTDEISENLCFCDSIPDSGIRVKWKPEDRKLILGDGTVQNKNLELPIWTNVTAVLSYEEQETSLPLSFRIIPKVFSEEEQLDSRLMTELGEVQEKSRKESELILPEQLDQYSLLWKENKSAEGRTILILGIMIAFLLWYLMDVELRHRMKLRRDQLLLDYPELINKFTLLVNAGMTVRQAWLKIAEDYEVNRSRGITKLHYAYEEMLTTVHELKLGTSEGEVYEQFGRRLGLLPYIKFSSLITQNRKKGNKGFTELLRQEALEAFEDRKEVAKRLGEEAGTKLLAPMMFLLIIVFLIILIPAFMAFQI